MRKESFDEGKTFEWIHSKKNHRFQKVVLTSVWKKEQNTKVVVLQDSASRIQIQIFPADPHNAFTYSDDSLHFPR